MTGRTAKLQRAALRRRAPKPPSGALLAYRAALRRALREQQAALLEGMLAAYVEPARFTAAQWDALATPAQLANLRMDRQQAEARAYLARTDAASDGGTGVPLTIPDDAIDRVGASVARKATDDIARLVPGVTTSRAMTPAEVAAIIAKAKAKGATRGELGALRMKLAAGRRLVGIERGDPARLETWRKRNVALVKSVAAEQKGQLRAVLRQATSEGWHRDRLRDAIKDRFSVSKSRADLIARDQVLTLNAELTRDRQKACGIEKFTWSTSGDQRVRESHAELDGKVFSWDDLPSIDGEDDVIPGSNYQCVPGDALVALPAAALKAYRRWHSGELTELVTDSGEPVRCTENHPVLTQRGWLPAHLVEVGDYLVEAPAESLDVLVQNPQRRDSVTAEKLFGALSHVGRAHRVRTSGVGFHGDSVDQEVDVVDVDWSLILERESTRAESIVDHALALASSTRLRLREVPLVVDAQRHASNGVVGGVSPGLALLGGGIRHALRHASGSASDLDAEIHQHASHRRPTSKTEHLGDGLLGDAGLVQASDFLLGEFDPVVGLPVLAVGDALLDRDPTSDGSRKSLLGAGVRVDQAHHLASTSGRDAEFGEDAIDRLARADAKSLSDLTLGEPGFVERSDLRLRKVLALTTRAFDGWVYNFETDCGWYATHGFIVHNCRCVAVAIVPWLDDNE